MKKIFMILISGAMLLSFAGCQKERNLNDFELIFYQDSSVLKKQIIDKNKSSKYDYNIYTYNGNVEVTIGKKNFSLEKALKKNKITMDEIIEKTKLNCLNVVSYNDGGSTEYHCKNYTIIKLHTVDGNRDVYIGDKDITLNDIK